MTRQNGPPNNWDDRKKYWYRKSVMFGNQELLDILDEIKKMLQDLDNLPKHWNKSELKSRGTVIVYILKRERGIDISLAKWQFKWLLEQLENV